MTALPVERVRRRVADDPALAGSGPPAAGAVQAAVARAVRAEGLLLPAGSLAVLVAQLTDTLTGLGPAQELLRDPDVTDVMINGPGEVWVERSGRLQRTTVTFAGRGGGAGGGAARGRPAGPALRPGAPARRRAPGRRQPAARGPAAAGARRPGRDGPAVRGRAADVGRAGGLRRGPARRSGPCCARPLRSVARSSAAGGPAPGRPRCSASCWTRSAPTSASWSSRTRQSCGRGARTRCGWRPALRTPRAPAR